MRLDLGARVGRRVRPILTGNPALTVMAVIGLAVLTTAVPSTAMRYAALKSAIQTSILTDMTIVEMPPGNSPGHMSPQAVSELRDRLTRDLPKVYTGELLTVKMQRLSSYIDAAASSENIAENTAAGITSFAMGPILVFGSHATVHGSYAVWLTGRHKAENVRPR